MSELNLLFSKRKRCIAQIAKLHTRSKALLTEQQITRFLLHAHSLDEYWDTLVGLQDRIHALEVAEGIEPDFTEMDAAEEMVVDIRMVKQQVEATPSQGTSEQPLKTARLPKLNLPKFHGDVRKWTLFKETFESLIHNNAQLTEVEKIHFLMGCLEGNALTICSGIPPTAENYIILWGALKDKYDDQTLIANTYLEQLLSFKKLQSENAETLNYFLENFHSAVEALKKLKIPDLFDYILAYLAFIKLPQETQKTLENSRRSSAYLSYIEIINFIKEQVKICVRANPTTCSFRTRADSAHRSKIHNLLISGKISDKSKCSLCSGDFHRLSMCPRFLEKAPIARYEIVKSLNLCLNCLAKHKIANCTSTHTCRYCRHKHHSLLHFPETTSNPDKGEKLRRHNDDQHGQTEENNLVTLSSYINSNCRETGKSQLIDNIALLSTAVVFVRDRFNRLKPCRFLIDSGSQMNFLTEECTRFLQLKMRPCYNQIYGLEMKPTQVRGCLAITVTSTYEQENCYTLDVLVVKKIVNKLPVAMINRNCLEYLSNVPLADPEFYLPKKVDGILGVEIFARILQTDKIQGPPNHPIAVSTHLGYVVMGSVPKLATSSTLTSTFGEPLHTFCNFSEAQSLTTSLKQFWEAEDVPSTDDNSEDECEAIFKDTYSREDNGRYIVRLPFRLNPNLLGDSFEMAKTRFFLLERKFLKNPTFKAQYSEIIQDYLKQGHMTRVTDNILKSVNSGNYFIPHHGVLKEDSKSTPLRIVFDASCKTSSSYSLNDVLHSGPKLQTDVVAVLLRFRLGKFGFTADLRQMFRQILLNEDDRRYQYILWRDSENNPLEIFSLNTVTFGLKCSPYLANRVIRQLGEDENPNFPEASELLKHDIYVDDLVYSVNKPEIGLNLFNQLTDLFKRGGFEVHKWATNCSKMIKRIPVEQQYPFDFQKNSLKVLGMYWDPKTDFLNFHFRFPATQEEQNLTCTKRTILSTVARCFDPLGFLAPALLLAKLIIQDLWRQNLDWDDIPPVHIQQRWETFYQELPSLSEIQVPRFLGTDPKHPIILIGFADACAVSYGAAVYLRTSPPNDVTPEARLLYAKTKVAPNKPVTIPKLELTSCLLLAKLLHFISFSLRDKIEISKIYALTDSTIALSWIKKDPCKLDVFVGNRVRLIQSLGPGTTWYHIAGKNNASDVLSRGQSPKELKNNPHWFCGPEWLKFEPSRWPISINATAQELEEITFTLTSVQPAPDEHFLFKFIKRQSSWTKLLRATVYFLRFIRKLPLNSDCSAKHLEAAELFLIQFIQNHYFKFEIKTLKENKMPPTLRQLRPFLEGSLIRVGGRLEGAAIEYDQRHPILLPKNNHLVNLLIDHTHSKNFHTGANLTLALLRSRYWILSARNLVRSRVKMCNFCFRMKPRNHTPIMGNLPSCRIQQAKPFAKTGVDYAGPLPIIPYRKRGIKSVKSYLCLFVCMTTKALHIELVSDLTTQSFLLAFKRFLARRGFVQEMYSDNGTNFLGAKTELENLYKLVQSTEYNKIINRHLSENRITWHLIPPNAPHMGGLWESSVKSVKTHLYKGIKDQLFTYEEMATILTQIEALLNSRPLCVLSSDPTDPTALTPAHFLTLGPSSGIPTPDLKDIKLSRLSRYQLIERIVQDFWNRWHREYLHGLQIRPKWNTEVPPIKIGDVVLLETLNNPPLNWPIGIIEKTYKGADSITRVVDVRTKSGTYRRPITKIYRLPTQ